MSRIQKTATFLEQTPVTDPLADHWCVLRQIVNRRVPSSHVEDILQEVALAAIKNGELPREPDQRGHWLCRVALTQTALFWRKRMATQSAESFEKESLDEMSGECVDPTHWLICQESSEQIATALSQLTPELKGVLVRKIVDGKTYSQIANEFSITVAAAEYRVLTAKRALRSLILQNQSAEARK